MTSRSWVRALILVAGVAIVVAGCGAPGSRQQAGTGIGAVAGGITGGLIARHGGFNPVGGAVIGAVAGGLVGSAIGRSLDEEERRQLALASELAAEQPVVKSAPPEEGAVEAHGSRDQYRHGIRMGRAQVRAVPAA